MAQDECNTNILRCGWFLPRIHSELGENTVGTGWKNENKSQGTFSLWEWNHYAGGLLPPFWLSDVQRVLSEICSKNTGWQTFLVCRATTVLLNWCPMSWYRLPRLCRAVVAKEKALRLSIRRLCAFAKTAVSRATKLSKMWPGAASRQRAGFMALSFIWW